MPRNSREIMRLLIQEATVKLFSRKNYNDVTMDEIAARAEITKRTLYKYFPSKAALFGSIFEKYLHHIWENAIALDTEGLTYTETLQTLFDDLRRFTEENTDFMRLFWMITSDALGEDIPPELKAQIQGLNKMIEEASMEKLRGKEPSGVFRRIPPDVVVHMLSAVNKGIYFQIDKGGGLGETSLTAGDLEDMFRELLMAAGRE